MKSELRYFAGSENGQESVEFDLFKTRRSELC
jgi:hypothetical protein